MDLANKQFGRWTSLYPIKKNKIIYWHCKCECGNEKDVNQYSLTSGKSKSCGCTSNLNKKYKDIQGLTFGELIVLEKTDQRKNDSVVWKCQCSCGNVVEWSANRLQNTKYPHCGCKKSLIGETFGKLTVIKKVEKITATRSQYWLCRCECGGYTILSTGDLRSGKVIGCGCSKSIGEYNIAKLLSTNEIIFKKEYTFKDLKDKKHLRYDFAILSDDEQVERLIEFDGDQHFNQNNVWYKDSTHQHDLLKNNYAKKHHIPLVRIPHSKRDSLQLEDLLGDSYLI